MSFTPNIPASGQSLGNSRPQINGNFSIINQAFAVNHVAFNDLGFGKHKFCTLVNQASDPTTNTTEGALYTKQSGGSTFLFWRRDNNATPYLLTFVDPVASANGYSSLPGGIIYQWGFVNGASDEDTITFPVGFSNIFNIQVTQKDATPSSATRIVGVRNLVSTTGFKVRIVTSGSLISSSASIYYNAIGN